MYASFWGFNLNLLFSLQQSFATGVYCTILLFSQNLKVIARSLFHKSSASALLYLKVRRVTDCSFSYKGYVWVLTKKRLRGGGGMNSDFPTNDVMLKWGTFYNCSFAKRVLSRPIY